MKKLKLLLILPFLLMTACNTVTETVIREQIDYEYDKIHIYGVGCVSKTDCRMVWLRYGYSGSPLIEYSDEDDNIFMTSSYALVRGDCPICDK